MTMLDYFCSGGFGYSVAKPLPNWLAVLPFLEDTAKKLLNATN
jgi:hypothetical protein